jgi:DNA-binding NarL/FixJ family response regulator
MSTPDDLVLSVVIIDDHEIAGRAAADVLRSDPARRFRVLAVVRRIADLAPSVTGAAYDVCVLGLAGVGPVQEIERLLKTRPVVVRTASDAWPIWVAAWVLGARAVLGRAVDGPSLAEAVWGAVHRPQDIKPQLARALLDAVDAGALPLAVRHHAILNDLASGLPRGQVTAAAGLSAAGLAGEIIRIRELSARAGLGQLRLLPAQAAPAAVGTVTASEWLSVLYRSLTPREREILELYADGTTDKEIAEMLGIRPLTVRNHMAQALLRCDIRRSDRETRLWFALAVTGRHRFPERILRRIEALRQQP